MATAAIETLIDGWQAAWSGHQAGTFTAVCAPAVHYEDPILAQPLEGVDALNGHAQRLWAAFPDARLEQLGERLADGRFVAAPARLRGTHTQPLADVPATGRVVDMPVLFYCELTADRTRLLRVRAFFDRYGAAEQLGILPSHGTFGEKALMMLRGFGLRA
jgi:steroid delta-isomerase-like uncharacterized protein